jgi:hypothetical protein
MDNFLQYDKASNSELRVKLMVGELADFGETTWDIPGIFSHVPNIPFISA